jgi:hypothetical protein
MALTEGKSMNGNPLVEGVLATPEVKNGNGRYYSKDLWNREINKYMDLVKDRRACGELDHPDSQVINLKNVSHNISKIWWDGENIMGAIEILPTPSGNILKALIQSGIKVGVSSRGMGSLKQVGEMLEVQEDFELLCWDLVSVPSTPGAYMKLSEGKQIQINKDYSKVNSLITEIICTTTGVCPLC